MVKFLWYLAKEIKFIFWGGLFGLGFFFFGFIMSSNEQKTQVGLSYAYIMSYATA